MQQGTEKLSTKGEDSSIYINTGDLRDRIKKKRTSPKDMKNQKNKCLIPYNNKWRKVWDYLIIVVAIYSTFTIPIKIAFNPVEFGLWYDIMDWFTSFIYLFDIFI